LASQDAGRVEKGLDCGFLLSVIHTTTRRGRNDTSDKGWTSFDPAHPGVLATLRLYLKSFADEYPINGKSDWTDGLLVGRYKGDVYDGVDMTGANPW
jgi:hypothetical protein